MKKILFTAPSLGVGGMERVLVTIADMLAENGYEVTLMLLSSIDDLRDDLDSRVRLICKLPKKHAGSRIPYIRHKLYDDGLWETRASSRQLYEYYVGSEEYDAEIAFFRGLCVKMISGSTNRAAVHLAWVHNDFRLAKGWQNNFKSRQQVYDAYARLDKVVCVSKQAMEGFIEAVGDTGNLTRIYNILPVRDIRIKAEEEAPTPMPQARLKAVVAARLFDDAKGQIRLIGVVSRLHDEGADISLTLVGGGPDKDRIDRLISELGAENFIVTAGEQKNPYPYIGNADLLICSSYYEGFNLTVAEALILGTPVLSTDCTGPNEILDGGKYGMITENSEEGLYQGLKKLYDDPELLGRYRSKASERQDFFNEERLLRQITDLFEEKQNWTDV